MEIPDQTWLLLWSVVIAIIVVLSSIIAYFYKKIQAKDEALSKKQTNAHQMGVNQTKGDLYQILGTFSILADYTQLGFISTVSKQMSVDMIGIKNDRIDFIEFKKKDAKLSPNENKIKKLVDAKEVYYQVKDIELPKGLKVEDRENNS
jgi:predicted Holliday junction resolvase-like endonuclease